MAAILMGALGLLVGVATLLVVLAMGEGLLLAVVLAATAAMVAATAAGVGLLMAAVVEEVVEAHRGTTTRGTATIRGTMTQTTLGKGKAARKERETK
jgi:hypothetical protein